MIPLVPLLAWLVAAVCPFDPSAPHELSEVCEVMPGSGQVHENLLRFSIRFSEATSADVLSRLSLVRADGTVIDEPFLKQELWSPDGSTLTVILGPGRVKTGLVAHDTGGRPLHAGEEVTLRLGGKPLVHWSITPEWIHPIDVQDWTITSPARGAKDPLRISFPGSLDGMDADLIVVVRAGKAIKGTATFNGTQTVWSFRPEDPWVSGRYAVLAHPHLEDPYGNQIGSAFETPQTRSSHSETVPETLSFDVP